MEDIISKNKAKYDKTFKVKLCKDISSGKTKVGTVAKEFNIQRTTISRWVAEYNRYKNKAFSGHGNKLPNQVEINFLKERVKQLEMENDILKKFDKFAKCPK